MFAMYFEAKIIRRRTVTAPDIPKTNRAILDVTIPIIGNNAKAITTPRDAPELIPRTDGPANGFLNNVCISNPAKLIPAPAKMDETVLVALNWISG